MSAEAFAVWDGVYPAFSDAPAVGLGFEEPTWRKQSLSAAREAKAHVERGIALDYSMRQRNSVLATLCGSLLTSGMGSKRGRGGARLRVLDFGGGPGFGFLVLQSAIPDVASLIDYQVVEVEGVCKEAALLFPPSGPTFRTSLPEGENFDIVFSASAIQYISDWRGICDLLTGFSAAHLLLSDVYAGDGPAFTTLQSYYGSRIPHWILNRQELVSQVEKGGYALGLQTPCDVKILGAIGEPPMGNLPADRRIRNSHHLLFNRKDS